MIVAWNHDVEMDCDFGWSFYSYSCLHSCCDYDYDSSCDWNCDLDVDDHDHDSNSDSGCGCGDLSRGLCFDFGFDFWRVDHLCLHTCLDLPLSTVLYPPSVPSLSWVPIPLFVLVAPPNSSRVDPASVASAQLRSPCSVHSHHHQAAAGEKRRRMNDEENESVIVTLISIVMVALCFSLPSFDPGISLASLVPPSLPAPSWRLIVPHASHPSLQLYDHENFDRAQNLNGSRRQHGSSHPPHP